MKIIGLLRVKNEARWIDGVIRSIVPLCDPILLLDDGSTDGTREIAEQAGAIVFPTPFLNRGHIDEAEDKDYLVSKALEYGTPGDWCFMLDGDEMLESGGEAKVRAAIAANPQSLRFRFVYLWDTPDQVRVDRIYGHMWRQSAWRLGAGQRFKRTQFGGNFHCGSVPEAFLGQAVPCNACILHLGYMHREDRIRKYEWYNRIDPNNELEDYYRHMVQGDVPDVLASAVLRHAGPIRFAKLA